MNTLLLLALVVAIGSAMDIFTDIVAITIGGVTPTQLGVFNTIGYVVYLFSLYIGGRLGDKGIIKIQLLFATISLITYGVELEVFFNTRLLQHLYIMYISYSILQAFSLTAVTAYIHEHNPSYYWEDLLVKRSIATRAFEFILLGFLSVFSDFIVGNLYMFISIIGLPVLLSFLVVRDPPLRIERTLYRIEAGITRIESSITNNLFIYELLRGDHRVLISSFKRKTIRREKPRKPFTVLACLTLYRLSNGFLLVQLPVYLRSLGYVSTSILGVYALARGLLIPLFILQSNRANGIKQRLILRGLIPLALLPPLVNTSFLIPVVVLSLILYLNSVIDILFYSLYVESLGRAESTTYLLLGESAALFATLLSGYIYSLIGFENIVFLTVFMVFLVASLI